MAKRIVLDVGHGGADGGTVGNGYIEKDLTLSLSLLLRKELERCGCEVLMTRTTPEENPSILDRGEFINANQPVTFLSIHFNSSGEHTAKGFEAIYTFTPLQQSISAKWIGDCIFEEILKLGLTGHGGGVWTKESEAYAGQNYFGVLRSSQGNIGLILEGLFIDNVEDAEFLKDPDFLKKMAVAYAKGLCKAWGWEYISEPEPIPEPEEDTRSEFQKIGEKAVEELFNKGIISNLEFWKSKNLEEETPLWMFFEIINRINK